MHFNEQKIEVVCKTTTKSGDEWIYKCFLFLPEELIGRERRKWFDFRWKKNIQQYHECVYVYASLCVNLYV